MDKKDFFGDSSGDQERFDRGTWRWQNWGKNAGVRNFDAENDE